MTDTSPPAHRSSFVHGSLMRWPAGAGNFGGEKGGRSGGCASWEAAAARTRTVALRRLPREDGLAGAVGRTQHELVHRSSLVQRPAEAPAAAAREAVGVAERLLGGEVGERGGCLGKGQGASPRGEKACGYPEGDRRCGGCYPDAAVCEMACGV